MRTGQQFRQVRGRFSVVVAALIASASIGGVLVERLPAQATEESVKVYGIVQPSVVALENAEGFGTGIILNKDGRILTNAHVISSPLPFHCKVDLKNGKNVQSVIYKHVKIISYHPNLDLALVQIDPAEHKDKGTLEPAKFTKQKASPGQHVYVIGNPSGGDVQLSKTITDGILSGVDRIIDGNALYQVSAPINPGNSGGPLCDREGRVIGVVTLKITDKENIGFAIPTFDLTYDNFVKLEKRHSNPEKAKEIIEYADKIQDTAMKLKSIRGGKDSDTRKLLVLAEHYYHVALLEDPTNDVIYYQIGSLLSALDLEKVDEIATAYLTQAIQLNPWGGERGRYYSELGDLFLKDKKSKQARTIWEEGISKFPKIAGQIWISLAKLDAEEKKPASAAFKAAVALRLAGSDLVAVRHLYEEQRSLLDAKGQETLDDDEGKMDDTLEASQAAADQKKKAGDKFIGKDCVAVLEQTDSSDPAQKPNDGDSKKPGTAKVAADAPPKLEPIEMNDGVAGTIEFPSAFHHTGKAPEASTASPSTDPNAAVQQPDTIKIQIAKLGSGVTFPGLLKETLNTESPAGGTAKVAERGACIIAGVSGDYFAVAGIGASGPSGGDSKRRHLIYLANITAKHMAVKVTVDIADANFKQRKEEMIKCLKSLKFD